MIDFIMDQVARVLDGAPRVIGAMVIIFIGVMLIWITIMASIKCEFGILTFMGVIWAIIGFSWWYGRD